MQPHFPIPWLTRSVLLALTFLLPVSCSKKSEEPISRPRANTSATLPDPGKPDAAVMHQWKVRLNNLSCEDAAKHANTVMGLNPTDPKGTVLLSRCLSVGNLAWFSCVMEAKQPPELVSCNKTYLGPPPD